MMNNPGKSSGPIVENSQFEPVNGFHPQLSTATDVAYPQLFCRFNYLINNSFSFYSQADFPYIISLREI
jgi:hypothetical protein